jgi:hypothetical protein
MRFFEFVTAVTAIGCSTGVIITTIDKLLGNRRSSPLSDGPRGSRGSGDPAHLQELAELRRQNEQLQKQLEWHARLLETEQRLAVRAGATVQRLHQDERRAPARQGRPAGHDR